MAILQAKTKYGIVAGIKAENSEHTIFKGIPFAKPPVGPLRFSMPREQEPWEGVLDCTRWAPDSYQVFRGPAASLSHNISEDCLYLNVWTPAKEAGEKLPVMFWIYGGGFMSGSSHDPMFDGEGLNTRGVILVTANYRTGVLGFLGLKEFAGQDTHHSTGNYGAMDILAALKWVHENIEAFGGDAENITVFGQSSGAMAVKMLLVTPLAKGLFRHAIAMSGGGTWDIDPVRTMEEKCDFCQQALDLVGWDIGDLMSRSPAELYRELDAAVEKLDIPKMSMVKALFQPSQDGYLIEDYYGRQLYAGKGSVDVDVMCGTIRGEWRNFPPQIPGGIAGYETEFALAPGIAWARRYVELGMKPVYHYFFDHDLPGEKSEPTHGSEMPYVFGRLDHEDRPWTEYDFRIQDTFMDYWANFARTGDPNGEKLPLWNAFTVETPHTMHVRNDGMISEDLGSWGKEKRVVDYLLAHPGILSTPFFA